VKRLHLWEALFFICN